MHSPRPRVHAGAPPLGPRSVFPAAGLASCSSSGATSTRDGSGSPGRSSGCARRRSCSTSSRTPNLNYVRITGVRPLRFLGETIYPDRRRLFGANADRPAELASGASVSVWTRRAPSGAGETAGERWSSGGSTLILRLRGDAPHRPRHGAGHPVSLPHQRRVSRSRRRDGLRAHLRRHPVRGARAQASDRRRRAARERAAHGPRGRGRERRPLALRRRAGRDLDERARTGDPRLRKRGADRLPPIPGVGPPRGSRELPCGGRRRAPDGRGVRARIPSGAAERGDALDRGARPRRGRGRLGPAAAGHLDRRHAPQAGPARGRAPAKRADAPLPRHDARRALGLARPRAQPAADGDPRQRAGGASGSWRRTTPTSTRSARSWPTSSKRTSGPERSSAGCACS